MSEQKSESKKISKLTICLLFILGIVFLAFVYWLFNQNSENNRVLEISRTTIINKIIKDNGFKTYLEIGLNNPYKNFVSINAEKKYSVDPYDNTDDENTKENVEKWLKFCTHRMTSDEFFEQNKEKFDVIFIDGLHKEAQVDKDIYNSLKVLNNGGYIVVHDCIPFNEFAQTEERTIPNGAWNGTVWKSFVKITQMNHKNLETYVILADYGVGIIHKLGDVEYELPQPLTMKYNEFFENINSIYNLISFDDFINDRKHAK